MDAINWLGDHAYLRLPVSSYDVGSGGLLAIDYLSINELALEVGGDEIYTANVAAIARRVSKQAARGRVAQWLSECLVEIYAFLECTPLDAKSRFSSPISFLLEHPYEFMNSPASGDC